MAGETTRTATATVPKLTLVSGAQMPAIGLGTWKIAPDETQAAVLSALGCGYRHIDCAPVYGNQSQVGTAIKQALDDETLCSRTELFVTSKLMTQTLDPEDFKASVETSLAELGLDYLDLLMLQWPAPQQSPIAEQWCAMEALVDAGLVRDIGVCNFSVVKLGALMDGDDMMTFRECRIKPSVNQVECGAHFRQDALLKYCESRGVVVQAYGPLGSGDQFSVNGLNRKRSGPAPIAHTSVVDAATATGMTPSQVLLAWNVARGNVCVIPKSVTPARQRENLDGVANSTRLPKEHHDAVGSFIRE